MEASSPTPVHVADEPPTGAGDSGPAQERGTVVLVHGFTQTGRSWGPIAPTLAAAGYRVRTVDAPGHGRSPAPANDLWHAAESIGAAAGPGTYVGYSMGGRLALHLALARPALVRALVLVGATPGIADAAERAARRADDERLAMSLENDGLDAFLERWLAGPLFASLPPEARGMSARRENTATGLAASLRTTGTGVQDVLWDRLSEIGVPVLLVAGELDGKFRALAERMAPRFRDARVEIVTGAGHACHLERPGPFTTALVEFLAAHEGRPPSTTTR